MTTTPRLGAPELETSQAIPETTVNEIARYLEQGAGKFTFKDRDLATPPGSPADGDCYLVAASPTGAWAGQAGKIAFRISTAWAFINPSEGLLAWVNDEDLLIAYDGSAWNNITGSGLTAAQIDERARDAVGAALVAGTGIAITPNDGADTITIEATGTGFTEATNAEIWAGDETAKGISPRRLFTAAAYQTLTDGATITPDFDAGINFKVTLGGNRTLANPTNAKDGQSGVIRVTQDATGSRTLTYGSNWRFPGGASANALSTAANAVDLIAYTVGDDGKIYATVSKAFAA